MEIISLYEGVFSVDASKKFIPFNPDFDKYTDRPKSIFIYVQPFLIKTNKDLILLDAGLGLRGSSGELQIYQNIRNAGYDPDDVTKVVMSHLHHDHIGGLINIQNGLMKIAFPKAKIYCNKNEIEHAILNGNPAAYNIEKLAFLYKADNVILTGDSDQICENIYLERTDGHSKYHQVVFIKQNKQTVFFGGDIMPDPEQLEYPVVARYDDDGLTAMELRDYYANIAVEELWICLFYHARKNAISNIIKTETSFKTVEYSDY